MGNSNKKQSESNNIEKIKKKTDEDIYVDDFLSELYYKVPLQILSLRSSNKNVINYNFDNIENNLNNGHIQNLLRERYRLMNGIQTEATGNYGETLYNTKTLDEELNRLLTVTNKTKNQDIVFSLKNLSSHERSNSKKRSSFGRKRRSSKKRSSFGRKRRSSKKRSSFGRKRRSSKKRRNLKMGESRCTSYVERIVNEFKNLQKYDSDGNETSDFRDLKQYLGEYYGKVKYLFKEPTQYEMELKTIKQIRSNIGNLAKKYGLTNFSYKTNFSEYTNTENKIEKFANTQTPKKNVGVVKNTFFTKKIRM